MAEASTIELTVTPQQLGKHLRSVRRRKGLSLSEVARGAGLSRRELVAYERGKVPIPESDLWVLAGSCGVDVAELMPATTSRELVLASEAATSIGDTVAQLRKHQEDPGITPYLGTLHKLQALPAGKRIPVKDRELAAIAGALGGTPESIDKKLQEVLHVSPDEAQRLREMIVAPGGRGKQKALAAADTAVMFTPVSAPEPQLEAAPIAPPEFTEPVQAFPVAPAAFLDTPLDAPLDGTAGHNVDVFEELARLPEPLPLGDPSAPLPDFLAAPTDTFTDDPYALAPLVGVPVTGPPEGTVELVDAGPGSLPTATAFGLAADAPPIDVAMRQGSDRWDLGGAPGTPSPEPTGDPTTWDATGWQPPTPPGGEHGVATGFWEGTDDWAPIDAPATEAPTDAPGTDDPWVADATPVEVLATESVVEPATDSPFVADWHPDPWTAPEPEAAPSDVNPWTADEWPGELTGDEGPWDHEPDPEAVNTGFYVDWGTPETQLPTDETETTVEPPAWDTTAAWETTQAWDTTPAWDTAPVPDADPEWTGSDSHVVAEVDVLPDLDPEPGFDDEPDALPPISWRADGPAALPAPEPVDLAEPAAFEFEPEPDFDPDFEPHFEPVLEREAEPVLEREAEPVFEGEAEPHVAPVRVLEDFVTAGSDWQLGNALPLVEVRGQGALVMRRADERWALADVTTTPDFAVEVDVDFRSGPGLGVLFRASIDDEGRMSGYSFDIDPIYDGGGYLVRQWHADRELWNPIARIGAADATSMYGSLTVRLVVTDDHLSAIVNGVEVLTVENLKQASVDRGREAATGDRVGVQAWSSSDLVINTLRVAQA